MKSKEKTTLLLHTRKKHDKGFSNGIIEVLELLFWKNNSLAEPALRFLEEIKKAKELDDSLWKDVCKKIGLEQEGKIQKGKYNSIIKKVRGAGMIYKVDGSWRICPYFENFIEQILRNWKDWKEKQ